MEVTDTSLGGYDGMLFRFDHDVQVAFYMRDTPMPLSIAYLGADGRQVSAVDMTPCADVDNCPLYFAAGPYRLAVEVPRGALPTLGITDTSVLTVTGEKC
jgi:uncharacterized membrane protein (UPF0127 family)